MQFLDPNELKMLLFIFQFVMEDQLDDLKVANANLSAQLGEIKESLDTLPQKIAAAFIAVNDIPKAPADPSHEDINIRDQNVQRKQDR